MTSNFNSETLLCNRPITIIGKRKETFVMKLPILKDKLDNLDFITFEGFCSTSIEEINKKFGTKFKDRFHLFRYYQNSNDDIIKILDKYFEKYMIGFKYVDGSLYWGGRMVYKEIFEIFCDYCAIAMGTKSIKDLGLTITDDMDEVEKRRILMERKIAKTKQKEQKNDGKDSELSLILAGVSREFGYSYSMLCEMTLYSIYYMYSLLGKIMSYEVGNVAAGNGLLKKNAKHNHWAL